MGSIRRVETAARRGNGMQAFSVCVYGVMVMLSGLHEQTADLPVLWPQWASPPHRRSWSWPRWWTDSPPTRTCRPPPAVASSGIPAPTGSKWFRRWKLKEWKESDVRSALNIVQQHEQQHNVDVCDSRSPHFSSRCAGCRYLFPARSCCKQKKKKEEWWFERQNKQEKQM